MPRAPDQSVISELFFVINLIGISSAQMGTRNTNQIDSQKCSNYIIRLLSDKDITPTVRSIACLSGYR